MIQNRTAKGAALNALLSLSLTLLFFAGVHLCYQFTYGVIDDPFIATVLNGAYTGTPDAHVVYIKYPLAWILASLFTVFPQVNWHFLLLAGCFQVCCFAVTYRICSYTERIRNKVLLSVLFLLLFWLCMAKMALTVHYSMCAAVLAATGMFCYATTRYDAGRRSLFLNTLAALLLFWTAYALRARTLFMLLPLAGAAFLYKLFREKPVFRKKNLIRWLICPVVLFLGVGAIELVHNANYQSPEWQEFLTFNDARTTLYDFYGLPDYEKNQAFYEAHSVSRAREYMYEKYYLEFQDGMEEDLLSKIADYRVKEYAEQMPAGRRIAETLKALPIHLSMKSYAPVNWILAAVFLLMLLASILLKKWRALAALLIGLAATLIPWLWMIYMGKPTSRVTMGIWAADLLFLTALLIDNAGEIRRLLAGQKRPWTRCAKTAAAWIAFAVLAAALFAGIAASYQKVTNTIRGHLVSGQVRSGLEAWCEQHPENLYICESEIVNGLGFDRKRVDNSLQNLYWPGGWTAKMAQSRTIWSRFGFSDVEKAVVKEDNIYIIAFRDTDVSYWLEFYRENYPDAVMKQTEEVNINSTLFTVYSIQER